MVIINLNNKTANDKALHMRKGIVADVKTADMANGEGVRTTIFVSGCLFNCVNCFNQKLQNFNFGLDNAESLAESKSKGQYPKFYDKAIEDDIIESLRPDYIDGLTLLGGEPFMNTHITVPLAERVREGIAKGYHIRYNDVYQTMINFSKLDNDKITEFPTRAITFARAFSGSVDLVKLRAMYPSLFVGELNENSQD